jgi:hypothetical protein
MEVREQPVHDPEAASGTQKEVGDTTPRPQAAVVVRARLEHPSRRGPDRHHPAAPSARPRHGLRAARGQLVALAVEGSVAQVSGLQGPEGPRAYVQHELAALHPLGS